MGRPDRSRLRRQALILSGVAVPTTTFLVRNYSQQAVRTARRLLNGRDDDPWPPNGTGPSFDTAPTPSSSAPEHSEFSRPDTLDSLDLVCIAVVLSTVLIAYAHRGRGGEVVA